MIVTFYSYKGGVGRSMAMANVAEILASRGYSVICCDWDLEAPGLERYFSANAREATQMRAWPGIIDLLVEYKRLLSEPGAPKKAESEATSSEQFENVGGLYLRRPHTYARQVPVESSIHLLTAGSRTTATESAYSEAVQTFDWRSFYKEWAGGEYFEFFRKDLQSKADFVFLDSRTGVTEQGGVCTHHLADLVVVLAAPNDLNLQGARWIVRTLSRNELQRFRMGRKLGILPVAARVEVINEEGHLTKFQESFSREFGYLIPEELGDRVDFLRRSQIPYIPAYSFSERVTAREDKQTRNPLLYDAYNLIATAVLSYFGLPLDKNVAAEKKNILLSYSLTEQTQANTIASILKGLGYTVWSPEADITLGQSWQQSVSDAMVRSDLAAFLIGPGGGRETAVTHMAVKKATLAPQFRIAPVLLPGAAQVSIPKILDLYKSIDLRHSLEASGIKSSFQNLLNSSQTVPKLSDVPFPGGHYIEEDAHLFYGRDVALTDIIERLRTNSVVIVIGDSGSGKTSLLLAGFFPALRAGRLTDCGLPPNTAVHMFHLRNLPRRFDFEGLVIIDQDSDSDLDQPVAELAFVASAANETRRNKILCFLRSNTARHFAVLPPTPQAATYELRPPDREALSEIVRIPPRLAGARFDVALQERLLDDFSENVNLGLMQQALIAIWRLKSDSNNITIQEYERAGGLAGIVNQHCENVLRKLQPADQTVAKDIMAHCVSLRDGAEDEPGFLGFAEALTLGSTGADGERVINKLAEEAIIVIRRETIVLGHPEIIRWRLLRDWINRNRAALRTEFRLREAAALWRFNGRRFNRLYTGPELALARTWAREHRSKLFPSEKQFLRQSVIRDLILSGESWARAAGFAALFLLGLTASRFDYRHNKYIANLLGIPPSAYVGAKAVTFRTDDDSVRQNFRNVPPQWSVVHGDGFDERSGAILVSGEETAFVNIDDQSLYNFDATFKVQFGDQKNAASWKLRTQSNNNGYLFTLQQKDKNGLYLRGYTLRSDKISPLENGEAQVPLPTCCNASDWYTILVKARNFGFTHSIIVEPSTSDLRDYLGTEFVTKTMRDPEQSFRAGQIGFLGNGAVFKLAYVQLVSKETDK